MASYASAASPRRLEVHKVTKVFHADHPYDGDAGQYALAECRKRNVPAEASTLVVLKTTPAKRFIVADRGSQRVVEEIAKVPGLEERVSTLEAEVKTLKEKEKAAQAEALDRRSAIALIAAVENASLAFGSTSNGPRLRVKWLFEQSQLRGSPTYAFLQNLQPAARRPFTRKSAPWTAQIHFRNRAAHPDTEEILVELLELDVLRVPMAEDAIVLLLVGAFHSGGAGEVATLFASAEEINDQVPTPTQRTWLASLGIGFQ